MTDTIEAILGQFGFQRATTVFDGTKNVDLATNSLCVFGAESLSNFPLDNYVDVHYGRTGLVNSADLTYFVTPSTPDRSKPKLILPFDSMYFDTSHETSEWKISYFVPKAGHIVPSQRIAGEEGATVYAVKNDFLLSLGHNNDRSLFYEGRASPFNAAVPRAVVHRG